MGTAAALCFALALFNLYVSYPNGIPPEFPLFLLLSAIFAALWLYSRRGAVPGSGGSK